MQFAQLRPGPAFAPVQSLLYYTQRLVTVPWLRRLVSFALGASVRLREDMPEFEAAAGMAEDASLNCLNSSGFASLGTVLDQCQIADIHTFLRGKFLEAHGGAHQHPFTLDEVPQGVRLADYSLRDIINCPHILQLANSPLLLRLASRYIGCKPTISAIGLRWSFPCTSAGEGLQAFHRDSDDWRFLKVFVYLTEVGAGSGPHVYVRNSHCTRAPLRLRPYCDEEVMQTFGAQQILSVTGDSGFAFAADTYGIHKGAVPTCQPRLLMQIQYSLLPVYAYLYRPIAYRGALELDAYINRLIVK